MGVGPPGEPGNIVSAVQLHLQLSSLAQNKTSFEMDLASWATWPHGPPWLGSRWGQMSVHNHLEMMNLADFSMKSYEIYLCSGVKTFVTFNDICCFIGQLAQKKEREGHTMHLIETRVLITLQFPRICQTWLLLHPSPAELLCFTLLHGRPTAGAKLFTI